jgi:hypothetical protein
MAAASRRAAQVRAGRRDGSRPGGAGGVGGRGTHRPGLLLHRPRADARLHPAGRPARLPDHRGAWLGGAHGARGRPARTGREAVRHRPRRGSRTGRARGVAALAGRRRAELAYSERRSGPQARARGESGRHRLACRVPVPPRSRAAAPAGVPVRRARSDPLGDGGASSGPFPLRPRRRDRVGRGARRPTGVEPLPDALDQRPVARDRGRRGHLLRRLVLLAQRAHPPGVAAGGKGSSARSTTTATTSSRRCGCPCGARGATRSTSPPLSARPSASTRRSTTSPTSRSCKTSVPP